MKDYNILLVDDDISILKALKRVLHNEDHIRKLTVFTVTNAMEALDIMKNLTIHLVISDEGMPGMLGNKFLKLVKCKFPSTMRVMLTGQASLEVAIKAINEGEIYRFLTKPWDNIELLITVRQALNQYDLEAKNRYLLKKVNQHVVTLQHLEKQYPGITKVEIDHDGGILVPDLNEMSDEDLDEIIAECEDL
ncbi:MAG: response regulator [bacterium]